MGRIQIFNAVAEGTLYDDIAILYYKLLQLDIPKNRTIIKDPIERYILYGVTEDFQNINRIKPETRKNNLEITLNEPICSCKGIVLKKGDISQFLDVTRVVLLRDGRVFIREELPESYINNRLPGVIKHTGEIFNNKDYTKIWKSVFKK